MEFHDQISVSDLALARKKMTDFLAQDNCKLVAESETRILAKRGSQAKLRLVGGMLVDIKTFPVRLTLDFSSLSGPGVIKVSGFDDLGFGLMIGMEEKYQRAIIDIMAVAVNSVASLRVDGESRVQQPMSQAPANYCSQCGAILKPEARFCSGCGQPA
jgi:membrane protease subunit (stomatin/prohibitin family)